MLSQHTAGFQQKNAGLTLLKRAAEAPEPPPAGRNGGWAAGPRSHDVFLQPSHPRWQGARGTGAEPCLLDFKLPGLGKGG